MKQVNRIVLAVSLSLLPWINVHAADKISGQGVVEQVNDKADKDTIVISGQQYRVARHAKIRRMDRPLRLRQLEVGEEVTYVLTIPEPPKKPQKMKPTQSFIPEITEIKVLLK